MRYEQDRVQHYMTDAEVESILDNGLANLPTPFASPEFETRLFAAIEAKEALKKEKASRLDKRLNMPQFGHLMLSLGGLIVHSRPITTLHPGIKNRINQQQHMHSSRTQRIPHRNEIVQKASSVRTFRGILLMLPILLVIGGALGMLRGCQNRSAEATIKPKPIAILIMVDRSGSIEQAPGGLIAFQDICQKMAQGIVKPIVTRQDTTQIELCEFVDQDSIESTPTIEKWEQIRGKINTLIKLGPYPADQHAGTFFSAMLKNKVHNFCKNHAGYQICVLWLTDGKPDEPHKEVRKAAEELANDKEARPTCMVIGPVAPDMTHRWREKLSEALSPLPNVFVVNGDDYRVAVDGVDSIFSGGNKN